MAAVKACRTGFGTSVPRFGKITVHPNLDYSGLYTVREPGCDPCLYHPIPIHEVYRINKHRTDAKDVWRYKAEMEDWSKNLGYRNQAILRQRRRMAAQGGPAWCTLNEPASYQPACNNVNFGRAPRFRCSKSFVPPPGTYYQAVPFKAPYGPHSVLPSFEWQQPCRFKDTVPRWSLAPDRYKIVDKESIEMKSKKVVSLRGPYDLFTGKRDKSFKKCSAATWPIALPGSFEKFKKTRLGVMNKTGREKSYRGRNALVDIAMVQRSPKEPGPADQDIVKPRVFKQNLYGFNSSYDRPPGYKRVVVWPGVGRYKDQVVSCGILGQGHKHVFLSKEPRTIGSILPEPMNSF